MKTPTIIFLVLFAQQAFSLQCWTCFGETQCGKSGLWVREFCPADEKVCYKFVRDNGAVFKMGCAFGDCNGAPGFQTGIKCSTCGSNVCNAGIYNPNQQGGTTGTRQRLTNGQQQQQQQQQQQNQKQKYQGGGLSADRIQGNRQGGWAAWADETGRQPVGDSYDQYNSDSKDYYGSMDYYDSSGNRRNRNKANNIDAQVVTLLIALVTVLARL